MKKKNLYKMTAFMFFSFVLLASAVIYEVYDYTAGKDNSNTVESISSSLSTEEDNRKDTKNTDEKEAASQEEASKNGQTISETTDQVGSQTEEEGSAYPEMLFAGDIYLSEYVRAKYDKAGINGILSETLRKEIRNADIAMANEEFSFSTRGTAMKDKQYTFRVDPGYVQIFSDMQLDIVSLANNHSLDYGTQALLDSLDTLKTAGIQYIGAGENLEKAKETRYFTVKGKTLAVLGASRVIPVPGWNAGSNQPGLFTTYDPTGLLQEITAAKEQSDYVIVYVHWGKEKKTKPEKYQRTLAKQYIDAGADLVIGCHPHILQEIEFYKDKPIVYSLGNFMFYNSIQQTAVLKAAFLEDGKIQLQLLPCKAEDSCTYIVEEETARSQFYQYMEKLSENVTFDENGYVTHLTEE